MSEGEISNRINLQTTTNERALFSHVFGNNFRYEDRKHLDAKAQSYWKNALLKYRKNVEDDVRGKLKSQQDEYEYKKGLIDEELKAYDDYSNPKF